MAAKLLFKPISNRNLLPKPASPIRNAAKVISNRLTAASLAIFINLHFLSPSCAYVADTQAQSVAPENTLFKLFATTVDNKIPGLDKDDPNSFKAQLEALTSALQDPSVAKPFGLYAKVDRFNDGSFSSLGELLPKLVPTSKKRPSPNMEFRTIKKLDVAQAMQLTLNQNLQIAISNQSLNVAKWNYTGALGGFAPSSTLNFQTNGARRYTNTLPRLPINADTAQVSARLDHGLFQGGKVLFTAISTHETMLQQKGLFASFRNDNLNFAVSNYYGILGAQAILNIRMDSAIFCVRQLREFKKLYIAQTILAARALNISTQRASDFSTVFQFAASNEKSLLAALRVVKNYSSANSSKANLVNQTFTRRLSEIERRITEESGKKQFSGFSSKYLENILRATMANEEFKRDIVRDTDIDAGLPESTSGANALNSPKAIRSSRTRYKLLLDTCDAWLATFKRIRLTSDSADKSCRDGYSLLSQEKDKASKAAATYLEGATMVLDLDSVKLQTTLQTRMTTLRNELSYIVSSLQEGMSPEAKLDVSQRIKLLTDERWSSVVEVTQQLEDLHARTATSIARASQEPNLPNKASSILSTIIDNQSRTITEWQKLTENLESIAEAYKAQVQKAKQVTELLVTLESRVQRLRETLEVSSMVDSGIANQLEQLCDDLQLAWRPSTTSTDSIITESIPRIRTLAKSLKSHSQLSLSLLTQVAQQISKARAIELTEAGYAFQVDQWNTQLANDIQDIIAQYLSLRTQSVALSTILNMDQRACLLSSENTLACKARDLSYVGFVELTRQTLNNRPELFAADEFRRAALANVGVAASALMPTVTAFGQVTSSGTSNRFDTIHMVRSKSFGLEVNYRLANLLLPSMANVASQGASAVQAYLRFREQLNVVMKEIHNTYLNVQSAKLRVATAMQKGLNATKQLVEADTPENRLKASASNLDVINALRDRNNAMVDVANQMANYNAAQAQLLRDSGQIYPISNYLTP